MPQNVGSKEDLITKNIPNRTKHSTIHRQQQQQVRLLLHVISQIILSNGVQQQKVIFTKTILVWQLQGGGGALKANLGGGVSSTPSNPDPF